MARKAPAKRPGKRASEPAGPKGALGALAHPATHHVVKVGVVQTHATDDPADNLRRTLALIDEAAGRGAQVVCTQELFMGPYFCQEEDAALFDLAEPIPGP